ncbi:MAG TPA: ribonuclease HII [Chloroflexia bacterium]|nr:ribonuclease HII [Chloroflexia bacterium]
MRATSPEANVLPGTESSSTADPRTLVPTWDHELELHSRGISLIAGVDEAGRGAWAGPLVSAAVIFPHPDMLAAMAPVDAFAAELSMLRDSKMLSHVVREKLLEAVQATACAVGVGVVSSALIDVIGVGPANRLAMARAVRDLGIWPDFLLVDAFKIHSMPIPQRPIIKGDATCMTIAAASVVAKVTRDHMMEALDAEYPGYDFSQHKGYGTHLHVEALLRLGVSPIHRRCFAPIGAMMGET